MRPESQGESRSQPCKGETGAGRPSRAWLRPGAGHGLRPVHQIRRGRSPGEIRVRRCPSWRLLLGVEPGARHRGEVGVALMTDPVIVDLRDPARRVSRAEGVADRLPGGADHELESHRGKYPGSAGFRLTRATEISE